MAKIDRLDLDTSDHNFDADLQADSSFFDLGLDFGKFVVRGGNFR